ncbi:MAG: type II 3-dehydroquinate dehydratase [Geminicoccaceae bacterium]|nr:type II 3-dehydroquinate dehydratase [Geminicoccaceae bacterium]
MTIRLWVLNGPNLNLLGEREPEIYGTTTLAEIEAACRAFATLAGAALDFRQTNHEGVLVDWIQEARTGADALVINPAGLSFRSIPVLDALKLLAIPIVEVHVSNIHARDELHRHSIVSRAATAVICGAGAFGYVLGLLAAVRLLGRTIPGLPEPFRSGLGRTPRPR